MGRPLAHSPAESTLTNVKLPYSGEYLRAPKRSRHEVVVFVSFYGGTREQLSRHIDLVHSIGFDAVVFDLKFKFDLRMVSANAGFGLKHIWSDQIEKILNQIPGKKIVFAFSHPSGSAIEAIARRGASDVSALVCDSGPSAELWKSLQKMYQTHQGPRQRWLQWAQAWLSTYAWHPDHHHAIHEDLKRLPKGFRILSIRGWKDKIITPEQIDQIFEPHTHIDWVKLSLAQAGHLTGLKDYRTEYSPPVEQFLKTNSTLLVSI